MADHDQFFKELLRTFFLDLLALVEPELRGEVSSPEVHFVEQELFATWPRGRRFQVDLLARVNRSFLVHVEVEARFRSEALERLRGYYFLLQARYAEPVLAILIALRDSPAGLRNETLEQRLGSQRQVFSYTFFGLEGCQAEEYLARPEPLAWALAALMRHPDRAHQKLACLRRVASARPGLTETQTFMLVNCIETYLELTEEERAVFERLRSRKSERRVRAVQKTWADRMRDEGMELGREKWLKQGTQQGARQLLLQLLARRFGTLPEATERRVAAIRSLDRLARLVERAFAVESLEELGLA